MIKDLGAMMKQAQEMQKKMLEMQDKLGELEMDGVSGGGMVRCTLNGKGAARKLKIDPSLLVPEDVDMLEDLVVAAFNDAKGKLEEEVQSQTQAMMGGMQLPPGMKLPF